jgi:hypothetical protein
MDLGDQHLKVKKASIGITQVAGEMGVNAMSMLAGTTAIDGESSRVLQLLNMVTPDELMDNEDYEGKFPHRTSLWICICLFIVVMLMMIFCQKFVMTSRPSVRSTARSCRSRSPGRSEGAGSRRALERSSSSLKHQILQQKRCGLWRAGSSLIELW